MLFSATFPKDLRELAGDHLATEHVRFRVGRAGSTHDNIRQEVMSVEPSNKRQAVLDLLNSMPPARTIIFVNSKRSADELDDFLFNQGMPCTSIHADRTQREREDSMRSFRAGKSPILIATGISARGIDVRNVVHVINYDLPNMEHGGIEEYTHRIGKQNIFQSIQGFALIRSGRTGRIGHRGLATSFFTERDEGIGPVLVRTLLETRQVIPEFLKQYEPEEDDRNKWESEGDFAGEFGEAEGGGWGGDADGDGNAPNAWGADASGGGDAAASGGGGWGGDSGGNTGGGGW